MGFWNKKQLFPYTNNHDENLDYMMGIFENIKDEWQDLYTTLQTWKVTTTEELEAWRTDVLNDIDEWETELRSYIDTWKAETEEDISDWEEAVESDLDTWRSNFETLFETTFSNLTQIKTDAEAARDRAETAAETSESAAEEISDSLAQIIENTNDIADLKTQVDNNFKLRYVDWVQGSISYQQGGIDTDTSNSVRTFDYIPISSFISFDKVAQWRIRAFIYDANKTYINYHQETRLQVGNYKIDDLFSNSDIDNAAFIRFDAQSYEDTTIIPTTPNDINNSNNNLSIYFTDAGNKINTLIDNLTAINASVEDLETKTDKLIDYTKKKVSILSEYTEGKYWNSETDIATDATASGYFQFAPITVIPGDNIVIHIFTGNSNKQNPVLIVDTNYNIINRYTGTRNERNTFNITIPENAAYILLTTQTVTRAIDVSCDKVIETNPSQTGFFGCYLSLLGDSFSAIRTLSDHYYYPSDTSDVQTVSDMWFDIVAKNLGMTLLKIDGWSGSTVASGIRENTYVPSSDPARCENLDVNGVNPDVILIAIGVNDFTYSTDNAQFGTWDGTTTLGNEADLSDYDTSTFKTAYATMIERIQYTYPEAFIVCITPWFTKRRTTNTGAVYLNAINKSISDYAKAVKDICDIMHVACIDGTNIGFNRFNYYPTYAADLSGGSTHPTKAGQSQIAKAIIAQLKNIHRMGA